VSATLIYSLTALTDNMDGQMEGIRRQPDLFHFLGNIILRILNSISTYFQKSSEFCYFDLSFLNLSDSDMVIIVEYGSGKNIYTTEPRF